MYQRSVSKLGLCHENSAEAYLPSFEYTTLTSTLDFWGISKHSLY